MEDYDYGHIRITPNIQDRMNEMHRKRAEERAERAERIAIEARNAMMRMRAECAQKDSANNELQTMLHAAMGWPKRTMLPAPLRTL